MNTRVRGGFTLLELVVAAALTALMSAAVVALVGRGLTAWQRADARLQQMFRAQKAFQQLAEDLRAAVPVTGRPFLGEESRLGFLRAESAHQLSRVGYRLEEGAGGKILIRERDLYPEKEGRDPETRVLLDRVRRMVLAYPVLEEDGGQKQLAWQPAWHKPKGPESVPELVRVTMELDDSRGGKLSWTGEVWVPQGSLGEPSSS